MEEHRAEVSELVKTLILKSGFEETEEIFMNLQGAVVEHTRNSIGFLSLLDLGASGKEFMVYVIILKCVD